ncbi:hypothetical protein ABQX22_14145 [Xanthomonas sp. WHRI 1810A]|uniref:hypothetical protein n=1 Tax=Xanthomonas sp. WHRI 1810A TaxID=3161565 RepID=UPI0032E907CE
MVKIKHKPTTSRPTAVHAARTSLDTPMRVGTGGKISLLQVKQDQLFSRDEAPIKLRT